MQETQELLNNLENDLAQVKRTSLNYEKNRNSTTNPLVKGERLSTLEAKVSLS